MKDKDEDYLLSKYQSSRSFRKEMVEAEENYKQLAQLVEYSDLSCFPDNIMEKFPVAEGKLTGNIHTDVYFYYGTLQPTIPKTEKLIMNLIKKFPRPERPYIMVYINNFENSNSSANLNEFKKALLMLPLPYYLKMRKIIIMKSTFFMKATELLSFGTIQKHLKEKTQYIPTLEEIAQNLGMDQISLIKFLPERVASELNIPNYDKIVGRMHSMRLTDTRANILGQNRSEEEEESRRRFDTVFSNKVFQAKAKKA